MPWTNDIKVHLQLLAEARTYDMWLLEREYLHCQQSAEDRAQTYVEQCTADDYKLQELVEPYLRNIATAMTFESFCQWCYKLSQAHGESHCVACFLEVLTQTNHWIAVLKARKYPFPEMAGEILAAVLNNHKEDELILIPADNFQAVGVAAKSIYGIPLTQWAILDLAASRINRHPSYVSIGTQKAINGHEVPFPTTNTQATIREMVSQGLYLGYELVVDRTSPFVEGQPR